MAMMHVDKKFPSLLLMVGENINMLLRTARKRLHKRLTGPRTTKRYVITPTVGGSKMHISSLLRQYPRVVIVDEFGDTALVEMSERERLRLIQHHPELVIEPNLVYKMQEKKNRQRVA
jgi:hypothetical protein